MYKYRIHGFNVLSDLDLGCYPHEFDKPDFTIRSTQSEDEAECLSKQICPEEKLKIFTTVNDLGKFYICDNSVIIIYYSSVENLNGYLIHCLLGFVISYACIERRVFFLHSSCVAFDGSAVAIIGKSGAGKSSLAATLVRQGGRIITDDTARLELDADPPYIYPSYPLRRLFKNILDHLDIGIDGAFEIIIKKGKFAFRDNQLNIFLNRETPLKAVIKITPADTDRVYLVRENLNNSILTICRNIYIYQLINRSVSTRDYLDFTLKICDRIPVYTLYRPNESLTVNEQAGIILREFFQRDIIEINSL